jgi:hypothetical protein
MAINDRERVLELFAELRATGRGDVADSYDALWDDEGSERKMTSKEILLDLAGDDDATWTTPAQVERKLGIPSKPAEKKSAQYVSNIRALNRMKDNVKPE